MFEVLRKFNIPIWLIPAITLIFIWGLFVRHLLDGQYSFAVFADNESFIGPVLSSMSFALRNGEWPLTMQSVMGGMPLYNFTQMSAFYPFYFIGLNIFGNPLESMMSMHVITIMHLLLFEINTYFLLRTLKISRIASLAGAVLIVFGSNTLGYAPWMNIIAPYVWFPLYIAGLIKLLEAPTSSAVLITIFSIVMLTFASPAQPVIHAVFISVILVGFYIIRLCFLHDIKTLGKILWLLGSVSFIALLLVSPVLIPAIIDFKNMLRWVGDGPPVSGMEYIPFESFCFDQVKISELPNVLFQWSSRHAVGSLFVGVLPIALAVVAFSKRRSNWLIWPFFCIAIYSLGSAMGCNLGFAYINYFIPMINKIREPTRFLFLFHFSIGVLAAIGIDKLGDCDRRSLLSLLPVLALALLIAVIFRDPVNSYWSFGVPLLVFALMIAITVMLEKQPWSLKPLLMISAWSVAVIMMHWISVPWVAPSMADSDYLSDNMVKLDVVFNRIVEKDPLHQYRVIFGGKIHSQKAAMLASYHGIRTLNAYFNPIPRQQFEEMYHHGPRKDNYWKGLGAKYLVCKDCEQDTLNGYTYVEDVEGYSIYEATDVLPRTYIVHRVDGEFHDLGEFAKQLSTLDLSYAPLFIQPGTWEPKRDISVNTVSSCVQKNLSLTSNRIQAAVQCDLPGVFVLNEFFTSAWVGKVDGKKETVLQVNGNQVGVAFPAGSHLITLQYTRKIFMISLGLCVLGFLMLGLFIVSIRKHKNDKECLLNK